jgi:hypothetical protein
VELAPGTFRRLAFATVFALWLIVSTGAVVRLTSSGLGCEHWPGCQPGQPFPEKGYHSFIEFGNRMVGGVTIDVEQKMVYDDPAQNLHIRLSKGVQHMDGQHALWYMRWRSDGKGDIGRISRQQKLFAALADQVLTPAILPRVPALVAKVNKIVTTDVPLTMQVKLALSGYTAIKAGMPTVETVPGVAKMIDGISYWVPDTSALHQMLQTWNTPS